MMQGKTTRSHQTHAIIPSKVGCFAKQLFNEFLFLTQSVIRPLNFATIFSCILMGNFCF